MALSVMSAKPGMNALMMLTASISKQHDIECEMALRPLGVGFREYEAPPMGPSVTVHQPSGDQLATYDAAERYIADGIPLVVIAGKEYGTGSTTRSRRSRCSRSR